MILHGNCSLRRLKRLLLVLYQGLSESVDKQKATESVDLDKAREALGN
jgi:hypothetical protein